MYFYSTLLIKPINKHYCGVTPCLQLTYKDVNGRQKSVPNTIYLFVYLLLRFDYDIHSYPPTTGPHPEQDEFSPYSYP